MARVLAYCYTLNNYSEAEYQAVLDIDCRYHIVGKEVGESGTPHLQGYLYFRSVKTLAQVSVLIPRAHIEAAKADSDQNYAYCSKGGSFYEKGVRPVSKQKKGENEVKRWELAFTAYQENRLDDIPKDILIRNLKGIEYASSRLGKRKLDNLNHEVRHKWYYGAPGTGKSRRAREENPGAYIKDPNCQWWDGYVSEEVVIIDDFDKYQVKQGGDMKRWMDIYPFKAPVKGGYLDIRPKLIVVTSNYTPEEIWEDQVTQEAILRRVEVTNFNAPYVRPNILN